MKILYLFNFPLYGNGSASFLRELTTQLKDKHEIAILSPDTRRLPGVKHYVVKAPQDGVLVGHPEMPGAKKFQDMDGREIGEIYTTYLWSTIQAVNDFKPDVVHAFHTTYLPSIARLIKSFYGTKYIITTHGSDLSYFDQDKRFAGLMRDANREARFITACSDFTKKWYIRMFGEALKRKTSTIVGGVNLDHYKKDPVQIAKINKMYDLEGKKVVLFTGRLTKHKGVAYLIRAAKSIKGTVLVIGDGPERSVLEEEIRKHKITNVIMTGYIENKEPIYHAFYERADVYVAPSTWDEPLGLTIIEAMAARTPVVATKKGGILSIINDKVNGFLIPSRNASAIAENVNMLLENDHLREQIGNQAYNTVVDKFSWKKIAKKFEKQYEELVGKNWKREILPIEKFFNWVFAKA
ncbi:MAG: glycosyltransferase family 4 protein [Candidatus Levybacteria bacterium]|nr:glycosyltransferase family 4 protein [Candidatus Levybacteria bacterium]